MFYFYVFYRVYTNIKKRYGLVVYPFMDFLGHGVACVSFGTKNQYSSDFRNQLIEILKKYLIFTLLF